jgi:hypothetical protein
MYLDAATKWPRSCHEAESCRRHSSKGQHDIIRPRIPFRPDTATTPTAYDGAAPTFLGTPCRPRGGVSAPSWALRSRRVGQCWASCTANPTPTPKVEPLGSHANSPRASTRVEPNHCAFGQQGARKSRPPGVLQVTHSRRKAALHISVREDDAHAAKTV